MKFRILFITIFTLLVSNIDAQNNNDEVLFKIDSEPVYVSEFKRVYNKNLDLVQDESQKDVEEYLELFKTYKLKLKEARALNLHEKDTYKRELESYKKQLVKNYTNDSEVTEALIEEAYQRVSYDVKANHILIRVQENASPQDTIVAYNKILKLRERTLSEGFDKVRKEVHNGQTVFGEELGYFSGFKMVYKFENAAFNTPVGETSEPFRTRFGYHIVNIQDKRKSRGTLTVAHIMIINKKNDTLNDSETKINDIYKKINQGENFEALAKQFSEDKNTASNGGLLKPFTGGQLSAKEFEDAAFAIEAKGEVSKPVKSQYGWHIIKLIDKKTVASFEEMKPELEQKIKRDSRSQLIDKALYNKLKAQYNVSSDNETALNYFTSLLNDDYYKRSWSLPSDFNADETLVNIGKQELNYKDFGDFLIKNQKSLRQKDAFSTIVTKAYDSFLNENLVKYQEENLEEENEEFAHVLGEYRDGLLLFDLMENKIWNTSKTDSTQIQAFYNANKSKYNFPKRVDAIVASSNKKKTLKSVAQYLKQDMPLDDIKKLVNKDGEVQVIFTSDIMDATHQALPNEFPFKQGVSKIYKHNKAYVVAKVNEVLSEAPKTFEEAKGTVISDYQNNKEADWIDELSTKYKIEVNQEALAKVKSQIKN